MARLVDFQYIFCHFRQHMLKEIKLLRRVSRSRSQILLIRKFFCTATHMLQFKYIDQNHVTRAGNTIWESDFWAALHICKIHRAFQNAWLRPKTKMMGWLKKISGHHLWPEPNCQQNIIHNSSFAENYEIFQILGHQRNICKIYEDDLSKSDSGFKTWINRAK